MAAEQRKPGSRIGMSPQTLAGVVAAAAVLTVLILLSQGMINLVVILLACAVLVALQRTVGDWLTEALGPAGRGLVVAFVVFAVGWQLLASGNRRAAVIEFLGLDTHWITDRMFPSVGGGPSSSPAPASSSGSSPAPAATAGSSSSTPSSSQPAALRRVRMIVGSQSDAAGVKLEARLSGADKIDGLVDFMVNGTRVATASVGPDGIAVAHVPNLGAGNYRVEARFKGTGDLGDASSRATFRRN